MLMGRIGGHAAGCVIGRWAIGITRGKWGGQWMHESMRRRKDMLYGLWLLRICSRRLALSGSAGNGRRVVSETHRGVLLLL